MYKLDGFSRISFDQKIVKVETKDKAASLRTCITCMHESLTQSLINQPWVRVTTTRAQASKPHQPRYFPFSKDERCSKQSGPSQGWHSTAFGGGSQSALLQSDPNSFGWKLADIQLGTLGAVRKRHRQHPKITIFSSWLILYPPLAPWLPLLN